MGLIWTLLKTCFPKKVGAHADQDSTINILQPTKANKSTNDTRGNGSSIRGGWVIALYKFWNIVFLQLHT